MIKNKFLILALALSFQPIQAGPHGPEIRSPRSGSPLQQSVLSGRSFAASEGVDFNFLTRVGTHWESYLEEPNIKRNVDFWIRIYSEVGNDEGIIHDAKYPNIIYEKINLKVHTSQSLRSSIGDAKKKWRETLIRVHEKRNTPEKMDLTEKSVLLMYDGIVEPNKFLEAAQRKRLRFQKGQKDSFKSALRISGRYLPMMEKSFKEAGLPIELTRLPFVESSFNVGARSKVGASGIWQFMRSTGKIFMIINDAIDERNDPIFSTQAAARLLKQNYEAVRSWPLAVIAYNHGRIGMMKAVRSIGSVEVSDVIEEYRSRSFGFASKNFFMEFLAAVHVERNHEKYFGKVDRLEPMHIEEAAIPDSVFVGDLLEVLKLSSSEFENLNPALTDLVLKGKKRIPTGFRVRIPSDYGGDKGGALKAFWAAYQAIPSTKKLKSPD